MQDFDGEQKNKVSNLQETFCRYAETFQSHNGSILLNG